MIRVRHLVIAATLACALGSEGADYAGWTVGFSAGGYGTILRTADSGATWTRQGSGQIADVGLSGVFAVDPFTAWVVGAADSGYGTIYHTTDGGLTWDRKGSAAQVPDTTLRKVATFGDNNVWAVGPGAILHSDDSGATWTNQIPAGYEGTGLQGVFTLDGVTVWATGEKSGGYATVLKSDDGGLSWTRQSGGDVALADHILGVAATDANTAWAVGGKPNENGYIALRTTNGGATWEEEPGVIGVQDGNELSVVNSSVVWLACDGNAYWSTNAGTNWSSRVMGPFTLGISAVSPQQAWAVVGGVEGRIWHTANAGATWDEQGIPGVTLASLSTVSFAREAVPEPSSAALLALGAAVMWGRGRQRVCRRVLAELLP
jgi:photosystem II stability/assembly factor-like uncharacterized protein